MAFIVLMQTTNDMDKDLKMIMDEVKAMSKAKAELRETLFGVNKATPTPTPAPDRTAQFVAEARKLAGKTQGAQL
jgi:hypothetical protein